MATTVHYLKTDQTETETEVVEGPCEVSKIECWNLDTGNRFLQCFDADADDVTVGTTTPDWIVLIPAGDGAADYGVGTDDFPAGLVFRNQLTIAVTTTPTGSTGPTNDVVVKIVRT